LATIEDILDYTLTHFVFEEALMEEAAYPYYAAHKAIHDSFRHRITEYRALLEAGENVAGELLHMLTSWLFNHIRHDDSVMADSLLQRQESVRSSTPRRLASAMGLLGKPVPGTDVRIS
jgi:hemerythrin